MKKSFLLLIVVLLLVGVNSIDAKPKQVELKFWKAGNDLVWHDYLLKTIQEYEKKNPNVKIEYAEAPWGQMIDTKLNTAYASGSSPDIIWHAIASIAQRADKGQYEPLDKYIAKMKDKEDILENIYELGKYKGKVYGMGVYPVPALLAYRKDFFQEVGLNPDKPPATWEELADDAVKLTKRDGQIIIRSGMTLPIDSFKNLIPFAVQNSAENINKGGKPAFDNSNMVETLAYFTDLFKNKKVSAEVSDVNENQQSLFSQGKSAISIMQSTWITQMLQNDPSVKSKIGFINMKRKKPGIWSGCEFLFINAESQHKQEAWKFIQYMLSKEEMWKRYQATNAL